jgi:hypothetical protein
MIFYLSHEGVYIPFCYAQASCKRVTVLERRDGDVLALACRGVSTALSARYKSGLEARREQHELILLHPHPTVPSYAATNPLTLRDSNEGLLGYIYGATRDPRLARWVSGGSA